MQMDLSIFRLMLLSNGFEDISSDLKKFDNESCHFFYDESNNIRKLWLAENDFNAPVDSDFVLGGVMNFGTTCTANVDELKNELCLQKSAKEMKFKHISHSKDFLGCLSEPKVKTFLAWLYQSDLYVHSSNINNLYWAIVDIVDTIEERGYIPFNFQMKNELYKVARSHYDDFYQLLVQNNYPNIAAENFKSFYQSIIELVDAMAYELPFELEFLRQGLKSASKQSDLVFLQDNPDRTVIDSYFHFYLRPIGVLSSAQHVFDNEYQIQEQFNKYELLYNDKKADNYCFVNSVDNPFIQVSDCIVGLLGKYYTYINGIDIDGAYKMLNTITSEQEQTLKLLAQIIYKSEKYSKLLLHSTESIEEREIGGYILANAL